MKLNIGCGADYHLGFINIDACGGQDISRGIQPDMEASRTKHACLFCHKYGWTKTRMKAELAGIRFKQIAFKSSGPIL